MDGDLPISGVGFQPKELIPLPPAPIEADMDIVGFEEDGFLLAQTINGQTTVQFIRYPDPPSR